MKIDRRKPRHWQLLVLQGLYTLIGACLRKLTHRRHKPLVVLYGHQLSGNLLALYEEWRLNHQENMDMCFLSLDPLYAEKLERNGTNILRCNRIVDMLKATRCQAMITDHGLHAMEPLLGLTDIRFIDVWHGIPFKGFVPEDFRLQHRYDEVWVSSNLLAEIYQQKFRFKSKQLKTLGYARTDLLFATARSADVTRTIPELPPERKVLFAPTWQQDDRGREIFPFDESASNFLETVAAVCSRHGATLLVRSHLNSAMTQIETPNTFFCSQREYPDTEALLTEIDILICDWSSIAFDFLVLERPILFLDVPAPFKNHFSLGPEYRAGSIIRSMNSLQKALEGALSDPDHYQRLHNPPQRRIRDAVYTPDTQGRAAKLQLEHLNTILK